MLIKNHKYVRQFGKRLRELRIEKGLSQEQLGNEADIPVNQIGRIERGEINTTIVTAKAIADALKTSITELFTF